MAKRIAKRGDIIVGLCHHLCATGATPTPLDLPFRAPIDRRLLAYSVRANGEAVALHGSLATNTPIHTPAPIMAHSEVAMITYTERGVFAVGLRVAAHGDRAMTCDENGQPAHVVVGDCTVLVGG